MTQIEYATYLGNLLGAAINKELNIHDLPNEFYGYFQRFMPYGEGVEKIFEPVPNGSLYYERLKPVYAATQKNVLDAWAKNDSPWYFVPARSNDEEALIKISNQLLLNLKLFARFLHDETLVNYLHDIAEITVDDNHEQDFENEKQLYLHEAILNWRIKSRDNNDLLEILSEAYYSINCDYILSCYLQYPRFNNKPDADFLKPYFELWQHGYSFIINDKKLIIYP